MPTTKKKNSEYILSVIAATGAIYYISGVATKQ